MFVCNIDLPIFESLEHKVKTFIIMNASSDYKIDTNLHSNNHHNPFQPFDNKIYAITPVTIL